MNGTARLTRDSAEDFPAWTFRHIEVEYDGETRSIWMSYKSDSPHCYTLAMLQDAIEFQRLLRGFFEAGQTARWPIRYFVMASKKPEVFSLGGDLAVFVAAIRGRDQGALLTYAYACIDVMYALTSGFGLPVVTLSAVAGQCMGGGFEGALATDFLIAEEGARLGVPEIGFNSFPGMGAVSFLQRRVGAVKAEDIIAGGAVYSPAQLFDLDLVDVVAPEGRLRETVQDWMLEGGEARWRRRLELVQLRRRCFPIEKEELLRIVELWAECSFAIAEPDLRHMERLVMAQRRLASRRGVQSQNQATSGGAPPQAPAGEG